MSKFFQLFSKKKNPSKKDTIDSELQIKTELNNVECTVVHLDSTRFNFNLELQARGKVLEDFTYHQIEITDDKNYFGLQYTDKNNVNHWLDMSKQIRKQCEIGPPYILRFRVKFFSSDPTGQMHDEYTRYLFVLQLKQMIRDGELLCEDLDFSADLASLSLQGELGDYDNAEHTPTLISKYRFLPEHQQTEQFELEVLERYKLLKNKNMVPSISDREYLKKCCLLPDYGVERHNVKDGNNKHFVLGLTPTGILIYENNEKKGLFPWNKVKKLSFKKYHFKVVIQDNQDQHQIEHTFKFKSDNVSSCKQIWKSCIENHAFYRLEGLHKPPSKLDQVFRLKSRFNASLRTEYQMAMKNIFGSSSRHNVNFQRMPSQQDDFLNGNRTKYRGCINTSFQRNINSVMVSESVKPGVISVKRSKTVPSSNDINVLPIIRQTNTLICSQDSTISGRSSEESYIPQSMSANVVKNEQSNLNVSNKPCIPPKPNEMNSKVSNNISLKPPERPAYVPLTSQRLVKPSPLPRISHEINEAIIHV